MLILCNGVYKVEIRKKRVGEVEFKKKDADVKE